jgi:hypothetical protein
VNKVEPIQAKLFEGIRTTFRLGEVPGFDLFPQS